MATSGTTVFTVTRDEVINGALRLCGVLQDGQSATPQQLTDGAQALNTLLKFYATKGWLLWVYEWTTWTTVSAQASYTIAPSGANITANRPLRIANAFVRDTTNNFDTPMVMLTRQQFDMLSPKTQPGIPNSFYYDPSRDTGVLYPWPIPNDATHQIRINSQRHIQDITSGAQNFDVPQEWFLPLKWQLASELGPEFGVTERSQQRIDGKAQFYLDEVTNFAVAEEPSVYFTPSPQMGHR